MDRREFLKNALTVAALAPLTRITAAAAPRKKSASAGKVTRRRYKNSALTMPLLGFGMMRLPRISPDSPEIDYATVKQQIKRALDAGVNYFDTAYFYHRGMSEKCAGEILSQYPRDSFMLADKMPVSMLRTEADAARIFQEQLDRCKVKYFDHYLLHNLNRSSWAKAKRFKVYEFLKAQQKAGKIKRLGFSFHDEPEVLQEIASAQQWDFAQIQLNYLDWTLYRSKEQYEILTRLGIPVIVMEPLRGGALATLNPEATAVLKKADPDVSVASWAFRYVGSLPNVLIVLSGMTMTEHLEDNIKTFTDFQPLSDAERNTIESALAAYRKSRAVPCTACRYCMPCPLGVDIPRIFGLYNHMKTTGNRGQFNMIYGKMSPKQQASSCVSCGLCKKKCPQMIDIPAELKRINREIKG